MLSRSHRDASVELTSSPFLILSFFHSQLTIPSITAFPRTISIPFYLSILILGPEEKGQTALTLPSPSELKISLTRTVHTTAQGASQSFGQRVGLLTDLQSENRVWYQPHGFREERGEKRWGGEVLVVGEFAVGGAATPTFSGGSTRGLLSCDVSFDFELCSPRLGGSSGEKSRDTLFDASLIFPPLLSSSSFLLSQYSIQLDLPLKGPMNDLDVPNFLNLTISSNQHVGQQQYWAQQAQQPLNVPPEFFSVDHDFGEKN